MTDKVKGIIEGFYGTPWSDATRAEVMQFAGRQGLTHYLFGPKDEPPFRDRWREPFTAQEMARFRDMKEEADRNGLTLGFALSPGLTIDFTDKAEIDHLVRKFQQWHELGIRWFGLFWDDIEAGENRRDTGEFPDPGHAQSWVTNEVARRFPDANAAPWVICPTEYWTVEDSPYRTAVKSSLAADIAVIWTGPEICSTRMSRHDAEMVHSQFGHPLVVWDNYPVNDAGMVNELHLGPLTGREPDFLEAVVGYLANPMDRPGASLVALSTIAQYLRDPSGYRAEESWDEALGQWGEGYRDRLKQLGEATLYSCCGKENAVSSAFDEAANTRQMVDAETVERVLMWRDVTLEEFPVALRGEIAPWVEKLTIVARWLEAWLGHHAEEAKRWAEHADENLAVVYAGAVERWLRQERDRS